MINYSINEKQLIWLAAFDFLTNSKQRKVVEICGGTENLFENFPKHKKEILKLITEEEFEEMLNFRNEQKIDALIQKYAKLNINFVTTASEYYPKMLNEIYDAPFVLYAKGNLELLNSDSIACVGTRRITKYGKEVTNMFCSALSKHFTIVSGLADGVDTIAAKSTLEANGKTIAVLGCGINNIYPATNTNLANQIVENGGLIISEYKPNEKAQTYYFPVRNRIIAALSLGVLIPEATEKSGSMHTKNYALEYNKDLFIVPGRITDLYSVGCNKVIKSMQGSIVLSPNDILECYKKQIEKKTENKIMLTENEALIINVLKSGECHFDEILEQTKLQARVLTTQLIKMEMKKLIKRLPNNYYSL